MATMEVKISPRDVQASQTPEHVPGPTSVVIFGASGDLTKRKLLPALFHLEQAGLLPAEFAVTGVARRPMAGEFAKDMREGILEFGEVKEDDAQLESFLKRVTYYAMSFDDTEGYTGLDALLKKVDQEWGTQGNRLFYLATAPEHFSEIIQQLGAHGMAKPEKGTVHLIIEKPFGHDLASARALNDEVNRVFDEGQIFRIDHYLGKKRSRTSSSSVSPMGSSSPSGTGTISITSRSPPRKKLASRAAGHSMRRRARCAMWCKTT